MQALTGSPAGTQGAPLWCGLLRAQRSDPSSAQGGLAKDDVTILKER